MRQVSICVLQLTVLCFAFAALSTAVVAQDSHLSQFYASPVTLNPASTGMFEGNYRVHLQYRNQWQSVIPKPFTTSNFVFDRPYRRFGFGAYVLNYRAGTGNFNRLNLLASGSYNIIYDPERIQHLSTGVQIGIIQKSVTFDNFTFDNQYSKGYSNSNPTSFDPALPNGESFQRASFVLPDLNFGILYYQTNKDAMFNPYVGVSGFHLTNPKETFYGFNNRLPIKWVGYGGTKIQINDNVMIEPMGLFMRQVNNNEINVGALAYYFDPGSSTWVFAGLYYRNVDALVAQAGLLWKEYRFGVSYDVNISTLRPISQRRGGLELSITYTRNKGTFIPSIL